MLNDTLALTLSVSMALGAIGLVLFIWGLRSGQFDDENKFTHMHLFDNEEDLQAAVEQEEREKKAKEEEKKEE